MSDIQDKLTSEELADNPKDGSVASPGSSPGAENERSSQQLSAETMRSLNQEIARTLDLTGSITGTGTSTATGTPTKTATTRDGTGDLATADPKRDEVGKTVAGECRNILPVLVEHLRSALELTSASSKRSLADEPLAPDPLGFPQENPPQEQNPRRRAMDLNLFGDLLVSDIKTALVRLQDTLRRVDADALSRYSATLESNDKLRLLQLISNLVSNLKLAKVSADEPAAAPQVKKRSRGKDRHTIGVSSEELARARRWLEEKGTGISLTSQRLSLAPPGPDLGKEEVKPVESEKMCDKHMKDAINQQQLQSRKDCELPGTESDKVSSEKSDEPVSFFTKVPSNNKFTAKKFKIKRANTIDIPNYLKLQAEKSQSCSPGLRRPIDIGDRLSWTPGSVLIPSFEPKTENDRKFLALINRNNDSNANSYSNNINNNSSYQVNSSSYGGSSGLSQPFKSFNYRQTSSAADKNWKSRFSNIKTAFDKPSPPASVDGSSRRSSISRDDTRHVLVGSLKLGRPEPSAKDCFGRRNPAFTHAATSPFQKLSNLSNRSVSGNNYGSNGEDKPTPCYYLPACASSGMLRAKLAMFDQQETVAMQGDPLPRVKSAAANTKVNVKPEKIIKDSGLNHCQNQLRNNGFRNGSYDKPSRHSGAYDSNGNIANHFVTNNFNNTAISKTNRFNNGSNDAANADEKKLQGQDVQKQSVAVQTNYPILGLNNAENDRHESLMRQTCPRPQPQHSLKCHQKSVPRTFYENENPIYVPPQPVPTSRDIDFFVDKSTDQLSPSFPRFVDDESDHSFLDENIANQDISDDRIVTRYTGAIATVENSPMSPTTPESVSPPVCQEAALPVLSDDVQRHNLLQQSLIRRLQYEPEVFIKPIQSYQEQFQPQIQSQVLFQPQNSTQVGFQPQLQPQVPFQPQIQSQVPFQPQNSTQVGFQLQNSTQVGFQPQLQPQVPFQPQIQSQVPFQPQIQPQVTFQPEIPAEFHPKTQNQSLNQNSRYFLPNYAENSSPTSLEPMQNGRESIEPLIESHNTQEKINIFEEKSTRRPEPLVIRPVYVPPKINVVSPSKSVPQSPSLAPNPYLPSLPVKYSSPVDSSDEYLVNCASRPHRSIVLSKSESWHQLALSKNHLQVPPPAVPTHKPPRVTSKPFESADRNMKKMEEKVQRYFHRSEGQPKSAGKRRSFSPRKNSSLALARSHTMPHIYDEASDVDKAFDSLFEETTRDNRL